LNTELLLAHVLGLTRMELYLQFDRPLTEEELGNFKALLKRRLTHEPLQYIIGETVFMGVRLAVDRRVLIPRPETEILVEEAISFLKGRGEDARRVLDIGTGSGNIPIAIARFLAGIDVLSVDASAEALELASSNVERHGASGVRLERWDVMRDGLPPGPFDLILSNPPYVPAADLPGLQVEVRDFEPQMATTDGGDGLSFFAEILQGAGRGLLTRGGAVMLEIGFGQSDAVREIALRSGFRGFECVNDYAGIPRVAICRRGGE
jgi:release factor glutamine methyltransferase